MYFVAYIRYGVDYVGPWKQPIGAARLDRYKAHLLVCNASYTNGIVCRSSGYTAYMRSVTIVVGNILTLSRVERIEGVNDS